MIEVKAWSYRHSKLINYEDRCHYSFFLSFYTDNKLTFKGYARGHSQVSIEALAEKLY